jgi:alpha-L-rhamnosidase
MVTVDKVPEHVELSIVCLGYYELYVNGRRVDDEPLVPSVSKLDKRALRIVHEIAPFLCEGRNTIGIWCSSGWYLPHQFDVHEEWTPLLKVETSPPDDPTGELHARFNSSGAWRCRQSNRSIVGTWEWDFFGGEAVDARGCLPRMERRRL